MLLAVTQSGLFCSMRRFSSVGVVFLVGFYCLKVVFSRRFSYLDIVFTQEFFCSNAVFCYGISSLVLVYFRAATVARSNYYLAFELRRIGLFASPDTLLSSPFCTIGILVLAIGTNYGEFVVFVRRT